MRVISDGTHENVSRHQQQPFRDVHVECFILVLVHIDVILCVTSYLMVL
jgi:hypothetical protein